jgi:thiol-disulfide isomerase/thioredoxin
MPMDRVSSLVALAALLATSCTGKPADAGGQRTAAQAKTPSTAVAKPEFVKVTAEGRAVPELVRESKARADAEGRRLLVYVGASWCEPCQVFHRAVEAGELDGKLAGVRFLEFDTDTDRDALVEGGYGGSLIPRFALPGADGRGTDAKIEGGVKGDGAVDHIVQRLEPLLARAGT